MFMSLIKQHIHTNGDRYITYDLADADGEVESRVYYLMSHESYRSASENLLEQFKDEPSFFLTGEY